jgi:hypothetical protein
MSYFSIDDLQVASPCDASWDKMHGSETARSCDQCHKHVYNISLLKRDEAQRLIQEKEGNLCVRFYRRTDGTVMTADCPRGLQRLRFEYLKVKARAFAFSIAILSGAGALVSSCGTTHSDNSASKDRIVSNGQTEAQDTGSHYDGTYRSEQLSDSVTIGIPTFAHSVSDSEYRIDSSHLTTGKAIVSPALDTTNAR